MLYIVFSRNHKSDDYYDNDRLIEYISEDKQKTIDFLNSERERIFNIKDCEIVENKPYMFICDKCYNWWYEYWIEKFPTDTEIRPWILNQKITGEL